MTTEILFSKENRNEEKHFLNHPLCQDQYSSFVQGLNTLFEEFIEEHYPTLTQEELLTYYEELNEYPHPNIPIQVTVLLTKEQILNLIKQSIKRSEEANLAQEILDMLRAFTPNIEKQQEILQHIVDTI